MKLRLIDDIKSAWRYASMWIAGASGSIMLAWEAFPDDLKAQLPAVNKIAIGLFALTMIARVTTAKPKGDE